jgi:vitamin B12 transporter
MFKYIHVKLFPVFIFLLLPGVFYAQDITEYKLNEIVTSASRIPVEFSNLSRSVVLISPREIQSAPVNSIQDLLKYAPGVDLRTRGVDGVQSDIGIRGGSFEETLVLIDGIKISDAQTGHHNLNLPLPLNSIEKIEILKGQGARIYGANTFSGAVNFITRKEKQFSFDAQITGGGNGLYGASIYNSNSFGAFNSNISFSKDKSDGYRANTAFDIINFFYNSSLSFPDGSINLIAGYNDKKFGANNFYSDKYPNQWEHTTTRIAALTGNWELGTLALTPKVFWRRNDDDYILDNTRPGWYRNLHKTNSFSVELQTSFSTSLGSTSLGTEITYDKIESTNLGNHNRTKGGLFAEQAFSPLSNINISTGFFLYNYSGSGWKLWPGFDISYLINSNIKIFASAGKAFRIPTFTELYYKSPANMGSSGLVIEETVNYEIGASYFAGTVQLNGSLFYKEGKNIIDWVRASADDIWTVRNETRLNTLGFEAGILLLTKKIAGNIPVSNISVNYTYLSMDRNTSRYESRYALDHLRHQLIISVGNELFYDITQSWLLRYEERENFEDHFIVDSQISKTFGYITIVIKAANLFNQSYLDLGGIPLPGRWISASVKFSWK